MSESTEELEIPPPEVSRFESLWLGAMALSVLVAIAMYDVSVVRVGSAVAAVANILLFGVAALLMFFASRRRSKAARLLLVPFFLVIVAYDLVHLVEMMSLWIVAPLSLARLALMALAIYFLFTAPARDWFRAKPV